MRIFWLKVFVLEKKLVVVNTDRSVIWFYFSSFLVLIFFFFFCSRKCFYDRQKQQQGRGNIFLFFKSVNKISLFPTAPVILSNVDKLQHLCLDYLMVSEKITQTSSFGNTAFNSDLFHFASLALQWLGVFNVISHFAEKEFSITSVSYQNLKFEFFEL